MSYGNSFANSLERENPREPIGVLLKIAGGISMAMPERHS